MVFFLATLVTAAVFITDRMEGVWERTLVAGMLLRRIRPNENPAIELISHDVSVAVVVVVVVSHAIFFLLRTIGITTPELLMAHILTQSVIVFLQCTEVIFFIGVVFGTENNGDNLTVIVLLSLTGFAGMLFGMGTLNNFIVFFFASPNSSTLNMQIGRK